MLGTIGCILAIALLIITVFKGLHPLIAGLLATAVVIVCCQVPVWDTFLNGYSAGMTGFIKNYVIMFFMGAAFGEFMSLSGFARSIAYKMIDIFGAKRGILIIVATTAILTYSGVSVFVVIFAIYPIALYVLQAGDIPRRLLPGMVNLGAGVFTMTMLPGSPALTNVVPANYLGTTIYAAPTLGIILAIVAAVLGLIYLEWQAKVWKKNGEHFTPGSKDVMMPMSGESRKDVPNFFVAFVPVAIIFVGNLVGTRMGLNATFAVCISLLLGILYTAILSWKNISNAAKLEGINKSAANALVSITNSAAIVGFAGAVKMVPAFQNFLDFATGIGGSPLLAAVISMDIICAITASSSGGIQIWCELLGKHFLSMGVNAQQLHRLVTVAAGTLDSLPHAGPNLTFMTVCDLKFKEGYFPIFVITCIIPMICQFLGLALAGLGIC